MRVILSILVITAFTGWFSEVKAQCADGEVEIYLEIETDNWGYECYWEIVPAGDPCGTNTIASGGNDAVGCNGGGTQDQPGGGYGDNTTVVEGGFCLTEGAEYTLIFVDDWGDGGSNFTITAGGIAMYNFTGTNNGNTWNFTAIGPADRDAMVSNIDMYSYVTEANINVTGEVVNMGLETITSLELSFSANGGAPVNQTFDGISIISTDHYQFQFQTPASLAFGENDIEVSVVSVNTLDDQMPDNDQLTKDVILGNPIPNVIDGYLENEASVSVMADAGDGLDQPRDLDFHPILTRFELWVINKGTENSGGSTVRFDNVGMGNQSSEWEQDGNAWHFMSLPTGIAFGENENFATSPGVYDANHDGGTPFTGPSLWSSVPEIYAEPSGGNGSHLDMLHVSPRAQGIAHEVDNVYWVVDGHNNDIVRYDFVEDHGPGNSYHGDAIIRRYADFEIEKDPLDNVVSHCVLDKTTGWLYVVDHGNQRVLRLNINTGTPGAVPSFGPFESVEEYVYITGYEWEEIITEDLVKPAGIDIIGDRLLVSEYDTGEIIVYDVNGNFEELGRIATGNAGVMGIKVGPWGRIWFVNTITEELGVLEGNPLVVQEQTDADISIYPNPASDFITVSGLNREMPQVEVLDMVGRTVECSRQLAGNQLVLDVRNLAPGNYLVRSLNTSTQQVVSFVKQ